MAKGRSIPIGGAAHLLVALVIGMPLVFSGCGPTTPRAGHPMPSGPLPAPSASAAHRGEASEGTVAGLRTGELAPVEHRDPLEARVVGRFADDRYETLALEVVLPISGAFDGSQRAGCRISVDRPAAGPYAFAALPDDVAAVEGRGLATATIWVRRARDLEGQPVTGTAFTPQLGNEPGHKVAFRARMEVKTKSDPKVLARWGSALALHLRGLATGPWHQFAAARIEDVFGDKKSRAAAVSPRPRAPNRDELAVSMDTLTGLLSIQETLQHDRPLLLAAAKEKRATPLTKLTPPKSASHPWDDMLRGLSASVPAEPLALSVPAEFWYLRASDLAGLFRMADQLEAWGTPAAQLLDGNLEERDLGRRYETQLGLSRRAVARALGPDVVEGVALAGSDPYLREGSDVTAVFRVKQAPLFDAALDGTLAAHAKGHGGVSKNTVAHQGLDIVISSSADGAVRQHRVAVNQLRVVSNSLAATRAVLDAIQGKRPRLADESDFRYMLARDAGKPNEMLGFFGDRFVAEVVGPRQKVLQARRQMAAAELMTPGFAALLYGWVYGKSPGSVDELLSSKLLRKDGLKHGAGASIDWRPGEAARSSWGTPSALTPLIDLPAPDAVTESERAAYERFSRTYETYWSHYIDPASLRLAWNGAETLTADLRVLPLIDGTQYRDLVELSGQARVKVPPPADGMRAVLGIGPMAGLRRELSELGRGALRRQGLKFDFLGDWAIVGMADRPRVAEVVRRLRPGLLERPESSEREPIDEMAEAARAPAYAAIGIRSTSGAALALTGLRKLAESTFGDMLSWSDAGAERGATIVRVRIGNSAARALPQADRAPSEIVLFYALLEKTLVISLDEQVARRLIGEFADGRAPVAKTGGDGAQLVFDLAGSKEGALFTVLGWLLSEQLVRAGEPARAHAEALLRGAPEYAADAAKIHTLSLAYFGAAPVPPYGGSYALGPDGVSDPVRGTASSPKWPTLPVSGSLVDTLLRAVGRVRSEIAFDSEGRDAKTGRTMQSLHVRTSIGLR